MKGGHRRWALWGPVMPVGIVVCLAVWGPGLIDRTRPAGQAATVPAPGVEQDFYDWHDRHARVLELVRQEPVDLVFIGDSITQLFGGRPTAPVTRGVTVWDEFYARRRVLNLGFGWDRTQNVLWRLEHGELGGLAPKAAVVLIGTNNLTGTRRVRANTPEETAAGIEAVCRAVHERAPGCRVVLTGLLPRRDPDLAAPIAGVNALVRELDAEDWLIFVDLTPQLAGPDGRARPEFLHDDVHPNAAGYRIWAEALEPHLAAALTASR